MITADDPEGAVRSKSARTFSNFPIILAAGIPIPFLSSLLDNQSSLINVLLIRTPTKELINLYICYQIE
jgi:hypothetical protein